jgi:hypothetical protein
VSGGFLSLSCAAGAEPRCASSASPASIACARRTSRPGRTGHPRRRGGAWFGLLAPAGTPQEMIGLLPTMNDIVREPHVIELAANKALSPAAGPRHQWKRSSIATWRLAEGGAGRRHQGRVIGGRHPGYRCSG